MKNVIKYSLRVCLGLFCLLTVSSCDLNYENTAAINPDNVWKNPVMINSFLTDIYGGMTPEWAGGGADESINSSGANMSDYQRGIISVEKDGYGFSYTNIDKINFFLDKLSNMPLSILSEADNKQLTGQALFWRAWDYWGKIRQVGGVPLILKPQDVTNKESLFIPRSKTSECVTQIIKDLDDAISMLPDKWDNANYGRIDKGTAMAFKGQVLLWYASPLFNSGSDQARWQKAYDANKQAVDFLKSIGKGLYESYPNLWKVEQNKEVIMVNQYYYPDHAFNQSAMRPEPFSNGSANEGQPIYSLLSTFPKKDGSSMKVDVSKLSDPDYNAQYLKDFIDNRDDRFYTTVFMPGFKYPSKDIVFASDESYWNTWKKVADAQSSTGYTYISMVSVQRQTGGNYGCSGFYQIKGLDETLDKSIVTSQAKTDWIEMRFAEVLMNYGECANELKKSDEALQVLYDIRKRANILSGSNGKYGITASTQSEIREAYIEERFVEFAFEGKRWNDLRRWKRFDIMNNQKHRAGIYIVLNEGITVNTRSDFDWTSKITTDAVRQKFHVEYIENLDKKPEFKYNLDLNHWFYPIKKNDLDKNSKLEQNNEWGGTFDPLL